MLVLDTRALIWWTAIPEHPSPDAAEAITNADVDDEANGYGCPSPGCAPGGMRAIWLRLLGF